MSRVTQVTRLIRVSAVHMVNSAACRAGGGV